MPVAGVGDPQRPVGGDRGRGGPEPVAADDRPAAALPLAAVAQRGAELVDGAARAVGLDHERAPAPQSAATPSGAISCPGEVPGVPNASRPCPVGLKATTRSWPVSATYTCPDGETAAARM